MGLTNTACKVSGYRPQELEAILFKQMFYSPTSRLIFYIRF